MNFTNQSYAFQVAQRNLVSGSKSIATIKPRCPKVSGGDLATIARKHSSQPIRKRYPSDCEQRRCLCTQEQPRPVTLLPHRVRLAVGTKPQSQSAHHQKSNESRSVSSTICWLTPAFRTSAQRQLVRRRKRIRCILQRLKSQPFKEIGFTNPDSPNRYHADRVLNGRPQLVKLITYVPKRLSI